MLPIAATTLEKLQTVPIKVWMNLGMALVVIVASIIVLKKAAEMNKIVLSVIIFVVMTVVGFNWVYSRNEPRFLTPMVEKIAPFFPSEAKQLEKQRS